MKSNIRCLDMRVLAFSDLMATMHFSFSEPPDLPRIDDNLDRWRMRSWQLSGTRTFMYGQTVSLALQNHLPNQTLDYWCLRCGLLPTLLLQRTHHYNLTEIVLIAQVI